MASQGFSRKRPAPGADPVSYPVQMPNTASYGDGGPGPNLSNDEFFQWGQTGQPGASYNDNSFAANANANANTYPQANLQINPQANPQPSNQLTRRPPPSVPATAWNEEGDNTHPSAHADWGDDIANLEARAQVAKREAQAKRKQIPPFVQKLNSFLEDGRNTELIRWSDNGNSFIVLDEDEFAKTLIPELFKHNNYASFVRQLNMYGFHKKVGLSDNSMRASERKNKSPSEYSNPYFRRGHPDLLWLIQKPKNMGGPAPKRKGKSETDPIDDDVDEYVDDVANTSENRVRARPGQLTLGTESLTQEQLQTVQRELTAIRHQQSQISRVMQQLRREHEQLYGQAATFQDQHNRHENSINAILTFLATVYNRSLQGHDTMPNISNLFSGGPIPAVDGTSQGNVVDVGDYTFNNVDLDGGSPGLGKPFKKQQLLLTNGTGQQQPGRASTLSPRGSSSDSPYPSRAQIPRRNQQQSVLSPNVEEVFDPGVNGANDAATPPTSARGRVIPQRDMMSLIQNANARNNTNVSATTPTTPAQDFSHVLNSLEATSSTGPLTTSQRADVLRMINSSTQQPPGHDNALINSTPPPGPPNFHRRLASTHADLDQLAKLQAEQDKSVQTLTNLLQPLSPTGSIPGMGDGQALPPPPLDIDDFLNHNEYFADFPTDANGNYDFGNTGLGPPNQSSTGDDMNFVDYKDDDELFANLNQNAATSDGKFDYGADSTAGDQYGAVPFETGSDFEHDGGGRVESVASSTVTTPKSSSDSKADGPTTRSKGRKMSSIDEDEPRGGRKRQRA